MTSMLTLMVMTTSFTVTYSNRDVPYVYFTLFEIANILPVGNDYRDWGAGVYRIDVNAKKLEKFPPDTRTSEMHDEGLWSRSYPIANSKYVVLNEMMSDDEHGGVILNRCRIFDHEGKLVETINEKTCGALNPARPGVGAFKSKTGGAVISFLEPRFEKNLDIACLDMAWDKTGDVLSVVTWEGVQNWNANTWTKTSEIQGQFSVNLNSNGEYYYLHTNDIDSENYSLALVVDKNGEVKYCSCHEEQVTIRKWLSDSMLHADFFPYPPSTNKVNLNKQVVLDCKTGMEWEFYGFPLSFNEKDRTLSILVSDGVVQTMPLNPETASQTKCFVSADCGTAKLKRCSDRFVALNVPKSLDSHGPYEWRKDGESLSGSCSIGGSLGCASRVYLMFYIRGESAGQYTCTYIDKEGKKQTYGPIDVKCVGNFDIGITEE